jgi:hypothetical protein
MRRADDDVGEREQAAVAIGDAHVAARVDSSAPKAGSDSRCCTSRAREAPIPSTA